MLGLAPLGAVPLGGSLAGTITLTASCGSFMLTGQAAGLKLTGKIPAVYGAYSLTGEPAFPRLDTTLSNLMPGMYTLTGQDAELDESAHWTAQDCTDSPWSHDECDCH